MLKKQLYFLNPSTGTISVEKVPHSKIQFFVSHLQYGAQRIYVFLYMEIEHLEIRARERVCMYQYLCPVVVVVFPQLLEFVSLGRVVSIHLIFRVWLIIIDQVHLDKK